MRLNDTIFYWQKALIVVAMVTAVVLLSVFGKNLNAAVLPALLGGLSLALGMLNPPVANRPSVPSPIEVPLRVTTLPAPPYIPVTVELPVEEKR